MSNLAIIFPEGCVSFFNQMSDLTSKGCVVVVEQISGSLHFAIKLPDGHDTSYLTFGDFMSYKLSERNEL